MGMLLFGYRNFKKLVSVICKKYVGLWIQLNFLGGQRNLPLSPSGSFNACQKLMKREFLGSNYCDQVHPWLQITGRLADQDQKESFIPSYA
jgi:hypothetical protein